MPKVARHFDNFATGHGCTGVSQITGPSTDVFTNNKGTERQGDPTVVHTIGGICVPHTSVIHVGSPNVFVNNRPCARVGDSTDAGAIIQGSPNVYANG